MNNRKPYLPLTNEQLDSLEATHPHNVAFYLSPKQGLAQIEDSFVIYKCKYIDGSGSKYTTTKGINKMGAKSEYTTLRQFYVHEKGSKWAEVSTMELEHGRGCIRIDDRHRTIIYAPECYYISGFTALHNTPQYHLGNRQSLSVISTEKYKHYTKINFIEPHGNFKTAYGSLYINNRNKHVEGIEEHSGSHTYITYKCRKIHNKHKKCWKLATYIDVEKQIGKGKYRNYQFEVDTSDVFRY